MEIPSSNSLVIELPNAAENVKSLRVFLTADALTAGSAVQNSGSRHSCLCSVRNVCQKLKTLEIK